MIKHIYAISVCSGNEFAVRNILNDIDGVSAMVPTCLVYIRKGGVWKIHEKRILPGYVFVECRLSHDIYYRVKKTVFVSGWIGGGEPIPLNEADEKFVQLIYNEGRPIPVQSFGFEILKMTAIKSIDKRARRVRVTIPLMGKIHTLTLGYE